MNKRYKKYTLTKEQLKFIQHTIPFELFEKYNTDGNKSLTEICHNRTYTTEDRIMLNKLRNAYIHIVKLKAPL